MSFHPKNHSGNSYEYEDPHSVIYSTHIDEPDRNKGGYHTVQAIMACCKSTGRISHVTVCTYRKERTILDMKVPKVKFRVGFHDRSDIDKKALQGFLDEFASWSRDTIPGKGQVVTAMLTTLFMLTKTNSRLPSINDDAFRRMCELAFEPKK